MSQPRPLSAEELKALPYRPCVGIMLVNTQGMVFGGQRIDSDIPAWQMPQGGIDEGETAKDAALRELWEETGVTADLVTITAQTTDWVHYDLPDHLVGKLWKGRFRGQKQHWFLMQFHGRDDQVQINTDHPEFSEWVWLSPKELVEKIVPFKREVYAQVVAEFKEHLP